MASIDYSKILDLDGAEVVGEWDNGEKGSRHQHEKLLRKTVHQYYLVGEGGSDTPYADQDEETGRWKKGNRTTMESAECARAWCSQCLEPEDRTEVDGKGGYVHLEGEAFATLRTAAASMRISPSALMEQLVFERYGTVEELDRFLELVKDPPKKWLYSLRERSGSAPAEEKPLECAEKTAADCGPMPWE